MANASPTSSLIGANLNADDATALFALGTTVNATNEQLLQYVCCTGTFTTGYVVLVNVAGTAVAMTTAMLSSNAAGYSYGFVQNTVSRSQFGWVAKRGRGVYVRCSGEVTAGSAVGLCFQTTGCMVSQPAGALGTTSLGVYITTSVSAATPQVTVATVTWPRSIQQESGAGGM